MYVKIASPVEFHSLIYRGTARKREVVPRYQNAAKVAGALPCSTFPFHRESCGVHASWREKDINMLGAVTKYLREQDPKMMGKVTKYLEALSFNNGKHANFFSPFP